MMNMPMPPPRPEGFQQANSIPFLPQPQMPMGMPTGQVDAQGTNPRDMSSALINKPGESPFGGEQQQKDGVPLWLKGFLTSPYAKWKGEGEQAMSAPSPAPAFQPPMQMGQTHQQPAGQMNMAPAWAQLSNRPQ